MPIVTEQTPAQPAQTWGFREQCFAKLSADPVNLFVPQRIITEQCQQAAAQPFPLEALAPQSPTQRLDACVANWLKYGPTGDNGTPAEPRMVGPICTGEMHIEWYQVPPWHAGVPAYFGGVWLGLGLMAVLVTLLAQTSYKRWAHRRATAGGPAAGARMNWKRFTMQTALLWLSVFFVAVGGYRLLACQFSPQCYDDQAVMRTALEIAALGMAGMAFLAWLKRGKD